MPKPNPILIFLLCLTPNLFAGGVTYYVSSSEGSDANNGTSEGSPFRTIGHVNGLSLQPGDNILFKCGDRWRGEMLTITRSGTGGAPITFASYPIDCADKPAISGAFPVTGWSVHSGNIHVADLAAGGNAGNFNDGINQVFRGQDRLTMGRWPNVGEGQTADGYSTIDGPALNSTSIIDNQLPAGDWSGAVAHIKGMRWYILNRVVTSSSGTTMNLNAVTDCWAGTCPGWGYFLNNHLATLDRDGEWFYDEATQLLYLYSTQGTPTNIEASALIGDTSRSLGGVILGADLSDHISHVTVENLLVERWYMHGITTPTNWERDENQSIIIRNNHILDVDATGINLAGWVFAPDNGIQGWRGGRSLTVENNWIRGAHHFGINTYSRTSIFQNNLLEDIGLIETAGRGGLGCGDDTFGGFCTENGDGIRIILDNPAVSGYNNDLANNRLIRIGYNGIDVFGRENTLRENYIEEATYSKSDGGGVRTYGTKFIGSSPVTNNTITKNIIVDMVGNTDGALTTWRSHFGFGIYIDNFSEGTTVSDNTVVNATASGILFQNSTGSVTNNTVFNSSFGTSWSTGILVSTDVSSLTSLTDNIFYGLHDETWTIRIDNPATVQNSDRNFVFNPYKSNHLFSNNSEFTLAQWQVFSGMDNASVESWFQNQQSDPPVGRIFYNDTALIRNVDLGASIYLDLDQNPVSGNFNLEPYSSRVLVLQSECAPSASLSGGGTICAGDSLTLNVALTGTAPWSLTWNDGFTQDNIQSSPATRVVSPNSSTTYTLTAVNDNQCSGAVAGSAPVTVNPNADTAVTPSPAVQGDGPLTISPTFDCTLDVLSLAWYLDGPTPIAVDTNPLIHEFTQPGVHTLTLEVVADQAVFDLTTTVLVPANANIVVDPNGDGCHDAADVAHHAPAWRNSSEFDPDDNGFWDIRDYLYINTGAGYPPCGQ